MFFWVADKEVLVQPSNHVFLRFLDLFTLVEGSPCLGLTSYLGWMNVWTGSLDEMNDRHSLL